MTYTSAVFGPVAMLRLMSRQFSPTVRDAIQVTGHRRLVGGSVRRGI